jgi:hypothetical protein
VETAEEIRVVTRDQEMIQKEVLVQWIPRNKGKLQVKVEKLLQNPEEKKAGNLSPVEAAEAETREVETREEIADLSSKKRRI